MSGVRKRSLTIAGHRTSISLEDPFWDGLKALADHRGVPLAELVRRIDAARLDQGRKDAGGLSSALRVAVLAFYRDGGGTDRDAE